MTGALGWQAVSASRGLAVAVAAIGGKAPSHEKGEWRARISRPVLMVVAVFADAGALWCRLDAAPRSGVLVVAFAPWPAATVLECSLTAFPASGRLSVRDVRVTTRMGRTVRYLIPRFSVS